MANYTLREYLGVHAGDTFTLTPDQAYTGEEIAAKLAPMSGNPLDGNCIVLNGKGCKRVKFGYKDAELVTLHHIAGAPSPIPTAFLEAFD